MSKRQHEQFGQRIDRIGQFHRQLSGGHAMVVNADGLIVAQPIKAKSNSTARSLFLCLIVMWAFKIAMYVSIGAPAYQERVASLHAGSALQNVGAYVMTADPVTVWFADLAGTFK